MVLASEFSKKQTPAFLRLLVAKYRIEDHGKSGNRELSRIPGRQGSSLVVLEALPLEDTVFRQDVGLLLQSGRGGAVSLAGGQ